MLKKIVKGFIVILCMMIIFYFSQDTGIQSTKKSDGVILEVSSFLGVHDLSMKEQQFLIDTFVVPVRKSAHFLIYLVLGITLISFLREFLLSPHKLVLISIFLAFLYACSDEVHQLFVIGRSGQFSDVVLDTIGASVGVLFYYILFRKKLKEEKYE
ncbi:MAG TPA: VanZ family protein [Candidatus Faecimonas gallistercoris]|nr:VanZ family protein [Candidatus Faecimonas gallistercoris]